MMDPKHVRRREAPAVTIFQSLNHWYQASDLTWRDMRDRLLGCITRARTEAAKERLATLAKIADTTASRSTSSATERR